MFYNYFTHLSYLKKSFKFNFEAFSSLTRKQKPLLNNELTDYLKFNLVKC